MHLLQPVRLPALHSRLVKAEIRGNYSEGPALFEVTEQSFKNNLRIEEGVVQPDEQNCVILSIQNPVWNCNKESV